MSADASLTAAERAESAVGLLRSLSINPQVPELLRSLMKETLDD